MAERRNRWSTKWSVRWLIECILFLYLIRGSHGKYPSYKNQNLVPDIASFAEGEMLYSAYLDNRTAVLNTLETRRIVGIVRVFTLYSKDATHLQCIFRSHQQDHPVPVHRMRCFRSMLKYNLTACIIQCPVYRNSTVAAAFQKNENVILAISKNGLNTQYTSSLSFIPISYLKTVGMMYLNAVSVCIEPLPDGYDNSLRIVEFIELYRLLNVKHFYIYHNGNVGLNVKLVLSYYSAFGQVTIRNIQLLPPDVYLQKMALTVYSNDCVYKAMADGTSEYVAMVSIADLLLPLKRLTLSEYVVKNQHYKSAFYFPKTTIYTMFVTNKSIAMPPNVRNTKLLSQINTLYLDGSVDHEYSNGIIRLNTVLDMGESTLHMALSGYQPLIESPKVAALYHYTNETPSSSVHNLRETFATQRFGLEIWRKVDHFCQKFFPQMQGICPN